jgi:plasmid stabilization system protein ParE
MRRIVRLSHTAREQLKVLLAQGVDKFGINVADQKSRILLETLETYLAENPHHGLVDRQLKLRHFHVFKTPFIVIFEYDDAVLSVVVIIHHVPTVASSTRPVSNGKACPQKTLTY